MSGEDVLISVRGLRTQFGDHVVHDNLDLDIRRGEILGVVGGSGTGKTVMMNAILGLMKPKAGEIRLNGRLFDEMSAKERRHVDSRWGVLFQNGALFTSLNVLENVMAPLREHVDSADAVTFDGAKVDRVYLETPATVELHDGERQVQLTSANGANVVVWNCGEADARAMDDMCALECAEVSEEP